MSLDGGRSALVPLAIAGGTALLLVTLGSLYWRARAQVSDVALASAQKAVTVVEAQAGAFRPQRRYVATVEPWMQAAVGPQLIAAYADTVLVRPGAVVKRGQVLATLDCRDANATQRGVSMQARAIESKQKALANQAARVNSLLDGGFVAPNEAEQKLADSESELAELMATQAKLAASSLAVNDCILRSPFDGEVASRSIDPGAFVRPGSTIVSVVDRSTVRVTAEVPEDDYAFVAPGNAVRMRMLATGQVANGTIARRSPAARDSTRTIHFEIDLPDPQRRFPVGTTAELGIDVGAPQSATVIPASAAAVHGDRAVVFVIESDRVKKMSVEVKGEDSGFLYLDPSFRPGCRVVTEGGSLLNNGEQVVTKLESMRSSSGADAGDTPP